MVGLLSALRSKTVVRESLLSGLRLAGIAAVSVAGLIYAGAKDLAAQEDDYTMAALQEVRRVRRGLKVGGGRVEDISRHRTIYGRPAMEVEGWQWREGEERWPFDQATYDVWSGLLSKYVNFDNASRRKAGEAILPMGSVSIKADGYLGLLYPKNKLSLEGIKRYRVKGKESVYYELKYSPVPREVPSLVPLVRILVNATTGSLHRFELAVDHLLSRRLPPTLISGTAAARIAGLHLSQADVNRSLGGGEVEELSPVDLYFVRPNSGFGAEVPEGGQARPAWVISFKMKADRKDIAQFIFIDAVTGRILGGARDRPPGLE